MASLTWSTPEKGKKRYIFYKKATSIGTSVDNDIVMPRGVSCQPHHARVIFDGRDFSVVAVDKGATLVHKKKRKSKCRLRDGDSVTVGDVELRFDVLDTDVAVQQVRKEENHHGGMVTTDDQAELKGLRRLCDFSRVLMSKTELPSLLDSLVDMAVEVAGADKGFLIMMDGDRPKVQAARNIQRKQIEDPVEQLSDSVIQRVVKTKAPLIVSDALKDTNFRNAESVLHLKLCSLMAVPLLDEGNLLGLLYVGNDRVISLFEDRHLEIFTIFAAQA